MIEKWIQQLQEPQKCKRHLTTSAFTISQYIKTLYIQNIDSEYPIRLDFPRVATPQTNNMKETRTQLKHDFNNPKQQLSNCSIQK